MSITIEQTSFTTVPTGKYPARIQKIEETDGKYGPQLKFTFELPPAEDGQPRNITGWTARKFSNLSKLYQWTSAALGPISPTYDFNSDDLIGKKVLLVIIEKETEDGKTFNQISQVLPYIKPTPPPPPPVEW